MRIFALLALLAPLNARAFPEFARHGYTNCITCHASPNGGGILTEYGRAISKELLSHGSWFFESQMDLQAPLENSDEQALGGTVRLPKGLSLGGDVRALQMILDNSRQSSGRFVFMQADLEAALSDGKRITVDGTIGRAEPKAGSARYVNDWLVSRRHWVSVKMGPEEAYDRFQMRFGRFYPAYGINVPEHTIVTRRQIGFDQQQETYNAEFAWIADTWNAYVTYLAGRPDSLDRTQETGFALQLSRSIGTTYRVGVNYLYGNDRTRIDRPIRKMGGLFALLGFTPSLYGLLDASYTYDDKNRGGVAQTSKFGWEFSQGVHLQLSQEYGKISYLKSGVFTEGYSLGLDYFPRAHWELTASAGKSRRTSAGFDYDNVFLFLAHYYL